MRDTPTRECPVCHSSFTPSRADASVCSATCRQRKRRGTYIVTEEDRAAIRKVLADHGHPRPDPLTPDEVRQYVMVSAVRT